VHTSQTAVTVHASISPPSHTGRACGRGESGLGFASDAPRLNQWETDVKASLTKTILLVIATVALSSCGTAEKQKAAFTYEMDAFVGQSVDNVLTAKGPPTGTASLSSGGRVIEYSKSTTLTSSGGSYTVTQPVYVPGYGGAPGTWVQVPQQHTTGASSYEQSCKLLFKVSKDNIVESWKAEGNNCY
jgi:hypothetical protein